MSSTSVIQTDIDNTQPYLVDKQYTPVCKDGSVGSECVPLTNPYNSNILSSMDNDYLYVLQNKYNQLQKENNTLLRNELSVVDENRRNNIKMKTSRIVFIIILVLVVITVLVYFLAGNNIVYLGFLSYMLIPIVLLVILIYVYKNVTYFKKHTRINVNDLNTVPRSLKKDSITSTVSSACPTNKCYTVTESGPFEYIDPIDNRQVRDTLNTLGNINEYISTLGALKKHFKEEDHLMPMMIRSLNNLFKVKIMGQIGPRPNFNNVNSIVELEKEYNKYNSNINRFANHDKMLVEVGRMANNLYRSQPGNRQKARSSLDGNVTSQDIQGKVTTDVVFGMSLSDYQKNGGDMSKLGIAFLNTQKLTSYFNSFQKWLQSQANVATDEYNKRSAYLNGETHLDSANTFSGHVGVYY